MLPGINPPSPLDPGQALRGPGMPTATPPAGDAANFEDMLSRLIQDVDQAQKVADDSIRSLATGDNEALHSVVLKLEEADLTFKLMKEIRDKLVQAYKEIISLPS